MLKGKTPLLIALVLGVLAGLVAYGSIKAREIEVRRGWNLVPVVVAAAEISEGTLLQYEMVAQRPIPEQFVTSSVVKPDSMQYIVNQKVLVPIQTGDPLLWTHFETSKGFEKLSTIIQKKGRAITIAANEKNAVGGWVRPNDHVDILGSFRDPATQEMVCVTMLQNVIVLATGKITGTTNINLLPEGARTYSNISLLVLPEEAEILVLAQDMGALTMALRNPEDIDIQEERGRATISTLLTGERTKALMKVRYQTIQVIRGMQGAAEKGGAGAP
jgi:pilus assembly protein CpaB